MGDLYRCYDAEDRCLYIGMSANAERRLRQHESTVWWPMVDRVEVEQVDEGELRDRERAAITAEDPLYNVLHSKTRKPFPPKPGPDAPAWALPIWEAARQVDDAERCMDELREQRDTWIVELSERGHSHRDIAEAALMSHVAVHKIIRKRKEQS